MTNKTIKAPKGPGLDQSAAGLRQLLLIGGGYFVSQGYLSDGDMQTIVGAVIILGTFAYGQWKTRRRAQQVSTLADYVSDAVATKL